MKAFRDLHGSYLKIEIFQQRKKKFRLEETADVFSGTLNRQ